MRPTLAFSACGIWKTCLKAFTSARLTRPSALAIFAPRTMAATAKTVCFAARDGLRPMASPCSRSWSMAWPANVPTRAPRGPPKANPAMPPKTLPQIVNGVDL